MNVNLFPPVVKRTGSILDANMCTMYLSTANTNKFKFKIQFANLSPLYRISIATVPFHLPKDTFKFILIS